MRHVPMVALIRIGLIPDSRYRLGETLAGISIPAMRPEMSEWPRQGPGASYRGDASLIAVPKRDAVIRGLFHKGRIPRFPGYGFRGVGPGRCVAADGTAMGSHLVGDIWHNMLHSVRLLILVSQRRGCQQSRID